MKEGAFIVRACRIGEDFCQQIRRFSVAILTDCKGKQRCMVAKRPFRRYAMAMKVTSKATSRRKRRKNGSNTATDSFQRKPYKNINLS